MTEVQKITCKICKCKICLCFREPENRSGLGPNSYVNRAWFAYCQQELDHQSYRYVVPYDELEGRSSFPRVIGFTKKFEHDVFGELTDSGLENYKKFVGYLVDANVNGVDTDVKYAELSELKLGDPFSGLSTNFYGGQVKSIKLPAPPSAFSDQHAAEMVELYSQSLSLDVPFINYLTNPIINDQLNTLNNPDVLNNLPYAPSKPITLKTIFRGLYENNHRGAYLSQFFLLNIKAGAIVIPQKYNTYKADGTQKYAIAWGFNKNQTAAFLNAHPSENVFSSVKTAPGPTYPKDTISRFICTARDLANWVAGDPTIQGPFNFSMILQTLGVPFNVGLPKFGHIGSFNCGASHEVAQAHAAIFSNLSRIVSFYWKWFQYRNMRPEAAGLYTHNQLKGDRNYGWPLWYLGLTNFWNKIKDHNVTLFQTYPNKQNVVVQNPEVDHQFTLPQLTRAGSPVHPSYPSGHAYWFGAFVTILKCIYNCEIKLKDLPSLIAQNDGQLNANLFPLSEIINLGDVKKGKPYFAEANEDGTKLFVREIIEDITVNDELNKAMFNVALGRGWMGIHYRSDSTAGVYAGEKEAMRMFADVLASWYENHLDGQPPTAIIKTLNGQIKTIKPTGSE